MIIDISIVPIQISSKRFTKVEELKRKFYEIKIQRTKIRNKIN